MINRSVIFPSLIIVLSAIILAVISQFEQPRFQDASVNAQFFPTVIVIMQIIICIALLVQYKLKKIESNGQPILSKMALFGLIFLCCYAVLISIIGYLYASLIAFTIYLVFFKIKKPLYYVVAWVFVFSIYYLFGEVFYIALPDGLFY
ncbi:tripartite tricarboxylate transporter TctB family protein [Vibrio sp. dhg]|uniref:tripartite tricarboxylate transporter TctB family protein n=1 Tax=Vibrio sp. dhg TaxID=2163016 RepID=UPI000E502FFE|nr:tripartite tricarboxylate transporter TctB family protein [Vibrio sp. dhg]AXT72993.1 tripartite tricarboxylate transporter TctB family protein [Vibrio sp. dhg]